MLATPVVLPAPIGPGPAEGVFLHWVSLSLVPPEPYIHTCIVVLITANFALAPDCI